VPAPIVEPTPPPITNPIIKGDIDITKAIDEAASSVDVALAGKRIVSTTNNTKVTIRNQINWPQGGPFAYNPHLDLRLRLPNLEKKWQLKFITYDEDQENRGINANRLKTTPIQTDYAGSIGLLQKLGEVNIEFEPRLQFQGGVQVSYFLRLTSKATRKYFTIRPEAQFFAKSDNGVGQFFAADMDFPIYKSLVFTLINEEQYQDRLNTLSTNNGIGFSYDYTDHFSQNYTLIFESTNRPNFQLALYTVATAFTQKIYKNILHYTVQPYLAFSNTLNYLGAPGINFELDLIF
jgi:hypothetical protein